MLRISCSTQACTSACGDTVATVTTRMSGLLDPVESTAASVKCGPYAAAQARTALAFSHVHGEHLDRAVEHAHAVLDLAAQHGWTDTPWPAGALVVLALSDLLGGNPEQALAGVTRAEGVTCVHHAEYRNALTTVRGAAEYDSGRPNEGWQLLRAARRQALAEDLDDRHVAFVALLEQQAALRLRRRQDAIEIVQAIGTRLGDTGECILLEARQHWASHRGCEHPPRVGASTTAATSSSRRWARRTRSCSTRRSRSPPGTNSWYVTAAGAQRSDRCRSRRCGARTGAPPRATWGVRTRAGLDLADPRVGEAAAP